MKFQNNTKAVSLKYFDLISMLVTILSVVMIFTFISQQQRAAITSIIPLIQTHDVKNKQDLQSQSADMLLIMESHNILSIRVNDQLFAISNIKTVVEHTFISPILLNNNSVRLSVSFVNPIVIMFSSVAFLLTMVLLLLIALLLRRRFERRLEQSLLAINEINTWSTNNIAKHKAQLESQHVISHENHIFDYIKALEIEVFNAKHKAQEEKNLFDQELREKVLLDPTTRIGTQDFFKSHLVALLEEEDSRGAVFLIQLKGCELVQNLYGETHALNVLEAAIDSIKSRMVNMPDSFLSRRGEFELALLVPDLYVDDMEKLAERLLNNLMTLRLPVGINRDEFYHLGISYFKNGDKLYKILSEADMALRSAQLQGPSQWFMYDPGEIANETAIGSLKWRTFLTKVINEKAFVLFSQPVISSEHHQILSYEIFSKIKNSRGELISPRVFLPMAEKCGLSLSLDFMVFEQVCEKIILDKYSITYSINFSLDALLSSQFNDKLLNKLAKNPKLSACLILEISEYHLKSRKNELLPILKAYKHKGLSLLADKVGQYVENAKYLEECYISFVKLHRSIVLDIDKKPDNQVFVQSLKVLCESLNIQLFCVGVENVDEWLTLRKMNLDGGQGHYFDEPIPQISNN